jgi:cold shock CspA family protein
VAYRGRWGVIDSEVTSGGCRAHYSSVVAEGYRSLTASQAVTFSLEVADQAGYPFRAVEVWPGRVSTGTSDSSTSRYLRETGPPRTDRLGTWTSMASEGPVRTAERFRAGLSSAT